jgi:Arc/MetJ-type ribon-helix-helix transcriptional regulator
MPVGSIDGMKLSVSLPDEDVAFVDDYAARAGTSSRSSVLHRAIDLLRMADLESAYTDAAAEWAAGDDAALWDATTGDGLPDAAR